MRAFLLLLFLSLGAQAQTVPKFPVAGNVTTDLHVGFHGAVDGGNRFANWYYLSDDGFRWIPTWQVLRRDKELVLVPEVKGETAQDYLARVYRANMPLPCSDTAIKSICDTARADQLSRDPPEPPRFVVSEKGVTGTTRPVRKFDPMTKALGVTLAKRVPLQTNGAPTQCACWAYGVRSGSTAWCVWVSPAGDTRADEVTQCRAE